MGCRTLLVTMKLDHVGLMPCNPSIGGPAKGHLVREIDALGGEMGRAIDRTFIQIRMLNTSKGPAVRALRAQADKLLYGREVRATLERQRRLALVEAMVDGLVVEKNREGCDPDAPWRVAGVRLRGGQVCSAAVVVLTTGTSLRG